MYFTPPYFQRGGDMGKRLANWIKVKRAARSKHPIAVSSFTVFLLGVGLSYWFFHFYTTTLMVGCEYPLSWLDGWESYSSPFQIVGLTIALCAVVWLLRLFDRKELNRFETLFQFIFILGLCGAFLAQKAYFFPYGTPSQAQVTRVVSVFYHRVKLFEEHELIIENDVRDNWSYDFPTPPFARKPEWPGYDNDLHIPPEEIFLSKASPTYADFRRLRVCYENYRNAQVQYARDMETWENYWEGFSEEYPDTAWRYQR